ncbi:unnamed protein product [Pedinophyceae sp. YPF-701]|nr:unnamed protein product [Pedinophyceae sp. YPF-701]
MKSGIKSRAAPPWDPFRVTRDEEGYTTYAGFALGCVCLGCTLLFVAWGLFRFTQDSYEASNSFEQMDDGYEYRPKLAPELDLVLGTYISGVRVLPEGVWSVKAYQMYHAVDDVPENAVVTLIELPVRQTDMVVNTARIPSFFIPPSCTDAEPARMGEPVPEATPCDPAVASFPHLQGGFFSPVYASVYLEIELNWGRLFDFYAQNPGAAAPSRRELETMLAAAQGPRTDDSVSSGVEARFRAAEHAHRRSAGSLDARRRGLQPASATSIPLAFAPFVRTKAVDTSAVNFQKSMDDVRGENVGYQVYGLKESLSTIVEVSLLRRTIEKSSAVFDSLPSEFTDDLVWSGAAFDVVDKNDINVVRRTSKEAEISFSLFSVSDNVKLEAQKSIWDLLGDIGGILSLLMLLFSHPGRLINFILMRRDAHRLRKLHEAEAAGPSSSSVCNDLEAGKDAAADVDPAPKTSEDTTDTAQRDVAQPGAAPSGPRSLRSKPSMVSRLRRRAVDAARRRAQQNMQLARQLAEELGMMRHSRGDEPTPRV